MTSNSCKYLWKSEFDKVPLALAKRSAIIVNTVICVVKALVDATPISGPAWVYAPAFVSLEIEEPTTLQTPKTNALFSLANLMPAKLSAFFPDFDLEITRRF